MTGCYQEPSKNLIERSWVRDFISKGKSSCKCVRWNNKEIFFSVKQVGNSYKERETSFSKDLFLKGKSTTPSGRCSEVSKGTDDLRWMWSFRRFVIPRVSVSGNFKRRQFLSVLKLKKYLQISFVERTLNPIPFNFFLFLSEPATTQGHVAIWCQSTRICRDWTWSSLRDDASWFWSRSDSHWKRNKCPD